MIETTRYYGYSKWLIEFSIDLESNLNYIFRKFSPFSLDKRDDQYIVSFILDSDSIYYRVTEVRELFRDNDITTNCVKYMRIS